MEEQIDEGNVGKSKCYINTCPTDQKRWE